MAIHAAHLNQRQINAITLGLEGSEGKAERAARRRERGTWQRARDLLASRIVKELITPQTATLDAGIWAPLVSRTEAERVLHEAAARGVIHFDPAAEPAPRGLSLAVRRLFARG